MLTITFYLSKTLKILSTFAVPFLITVVFWPLFLKTGKMLSYMATWTHQRTNGDTTNRWKCFTKLCSTNVCWEIFLPSINWILFKRTTFTPRAVYELPFKITIENTIFSQPTKSRENITCGGDNMSLTNGRGSRVQSRGQSRVQSGGCGSKVAVSGPKWRSRVQCRGRRKWFGVRGNWVKTSDMKKI